MGQGEDRWNRRKALFEAALTETPERRRDMLLVASGGDLSLVEEVMRLLAHDLAAGSSGGESEGEVAGPRDRDPLARDLGHLGAPLLAGTTLFADPAEFLPYELRGVIGEGGMGVVFLAERPDLGMRVAIKVLRDAWLSPARRNRFLAEERTLAQLSHPDIARILDARVLSDGTPWFAMEYVDGAPISDHCQQNDVPLDERLRLVRRVCEAVAHAHAKHVVHRDLKPSNILVTTTGEVRLVDFGIAKRLTSTLDGDSGERTTIALLTPAYAAPEQVSGGEVSVRTDVYALGVILHEVLTGRRPDAGDRGHAGAGERRLVLSPQSLGMRAAPARTLRALDAIIRMATARDADRRYANVEALIRDLDRVRRGQPIDRAFSRAPAVTFVRRHAYAVASALALVAMGALGAGRVWNPTIAGEPASTPVLAVLPLRHEGIDSSANHFRIAIAEEMANLLGQRRGMVVRDFTRTRDFTDDTLDAGAVGRRIGATHVLTGEYRAIDRELVVRLRLVDASRDRTVWSDELRVDRGSVLDLQGQLATVANGSVPSVLGLPASRAHGASTRPRNERAYQLYLQSAAARYDPGPGNARAIALLEEAVRLDSTFAAAWGMLSRRYYIASRFDTGDPALPARMQAALQRWLALDPGDVTAGARFVIGQVENGQLVDAYRQLQELLRRRSDSPDGHFVLSYVLRFAGLLKESARECALTMSLDAHNFGWRSCAVPHILMGDYASAGGFVSLDPGSEWAKAMEVHMLMRAGLATAALAAPRPNVPQWKSYDLLLACADGAQQQVRDSLRALVLPSADPESNYFAATHLAYCGQVEQAADLLGRAISRGYCSYPVMETDPLLAPLRARPAFADIRSRGADCQARFVAAVSSRMEDAR